MRGADTYRYERIDLPKTYRVRERALQFLPTWSGQHLEHNAQRQEAPTRATANSDITIEGKKVLPFLLRFLFANCPRLLGVLFSPLYFYFTPFPISIIP